MYTFKNKKVNYYDNKIDSENTIIALHGWGQNIQMMQPLVSELIIKNRVIIFDLPGNGKSEEPDEVFSVYDYTKMLHDFIKENKIKNPILIGHSFGGKIALIYASKYYVKKLVVLAPTYKKSTKKISLRLRIAKKLKFIPLVDKYLKYLRNKMGSEDYKNASEVMRKIMVKHVNTDITDIIKNIKASTLIVWGENDQAVNISLAYELEKMIKDSGVVVYKNSTHYAYLENINNLKIVLRSFLEEKESK